MTKKSTQATAPSVFDDSLHTIPEICAALSIGATKCWELIKKDELEVVRLGNRCTRIKKSSLDRLIQNGVSTRQSTLPRNLTRVAVP
ncbi:MAG: helix-turn-helix transcriptional regulator [Gammaproteobacteria bacterium]